MRHRKTKLRLNRPGSHRRALVKNLLISFFTHQKIKTTEAKAKAIKPLAEKLITLGKQNSLAHRRQIIKKTGSNRVASIILNDIGPRFAKRNGGYTRIVKIAPRQGDGALLVYLMLVE